MIDLHTHTFFSDGVLIPSELVYRAKVKGYEAIGVTDHGDFTNFDLIIPRIARAADALTRQYGITVVPGIELTYVPPPLIAKAVKACRRLGAKLVVVHGETPAETVPAGTNRAALLSGADILAHPGRLTAEEAGLAARRNVCLEITTRRGHNATNRHVADLAKLHRAPLVLNTDSHEPEDLLTGEKLRRTLASGGLTRDDYRQMQLNAAALVRSGTGKK
ncbi:MAG: histidinol phosphate phosphatase domain-containing protein [Endomicrobiales bacterium]